MPYYSLEAALLPPTDSSSPVTDHSTRASTPGDDRADLDMRFLYDLWFVARLSIDKHPLPVMFSELAFVAAATALALWMLPVPASYVALSKENSSFGATMLAVGLLLLMALTLVLPLAHLTSSSNEGLPATTHLRRRSLPLLFMSVQMYNVSGFFISIVPSLIYQALTADPRECAALPALLLRAIGYLCAVTLCKALVSVVQSSCALLWRQVTTST